VKIRNCLLRLLDPRLVPQVPRVAFGPSRGGGPATRPFCQSSAKSSGYHGSEVGSSGLTFVVPSCRKSPSVILETTTVFAKAVLGSTSHGGCWGAEAGHGLGRWLHWRERRLSPCAAGEGLQTICRLQPARLSSSSAEQRCLLLPFAFEGL